LDQERLFTVFVAPIQTGKLDRVANKEDWQIVEDKILVAILCKDLGRGVGNYLVKIVSGNWDIISGVCLEEIMRLLEIGVGFLPQHLHFVAHPRTSRTVSLAACCGRDPNKHLCLPPRFVQEFGIGKITCNVCNFEFSPGSGSFSLNAPIGSQLWGC
jgi:hypothetical protein